MLYVVATPIGDTNEITLRALELLKSTANIICESTKETSKLLKVHGITGKTYHVLDEHSVDEDIQVLTKLCEEQDVVLVSDCGTPVFCDPGALLIRECRKKNIPARSVLGASSLMGLLSLASERVNQFVFVGFLPANTEERDLAVAALKLEPRAMIFMDTPYRQVKLLNELKENFPYRRALLVQNLSQESERILEGKFEDLIRASETDKAEFMILVYQDKNLPPPKPAKAAVRQTPPRSSKFRLPGPKAKKPRFGMSRGPRK